MRNVWLLMLLLAVLCCGAAHAAETGAQLGARQTLPENPEAWTELLREAFALPRAAWQILSAQLPDALQETPGAGRALLLVAALAWLGLCAWFYRLLSRTLNVGRYAAHSLLGRLLRIIEQLLRGNRINIVVTGLLLMVPPLAKAPWPSADIVPILSLVWLGYWLALDLARLLLVDTRFVAGEPYPRLYRTLRWGLAVVALLSALMMLARVLPVTATLQSLLDRLFLLLALPILLLALRGRGMLLSPLRPLLSAAWLRVAQRLYSALTLTLLGSALLGVLGYLNLSGVIAVHIGWLLLVLFAWLLLRGLLGDGFARLREHVIRRSPHLDWSQPLLRPAARLSQVVLFLFAVWVLLQIYHWDADSAPLRMLKALLLTPLFELGGKALTPFSLLLTLFIIVVVLRLASWSREATYRWLFARIANSGARHSLSVFTQYLVVLVGFLIALRVLGLDLTTLTVFAGALGVGMGLGLQNIANNFISGVLLLLERPLRTGDTVTINNNEGAVTHIGLRSLTVKTSDNQEVIIPNSEVISHPFTNWTYTDNVVRTAVTVSIHQQNDVHRAHALIAEALRGHPEILTQPPAEAWLDALGPTAISFHVQYFTELGSTNRDAVKSKVLLQIWDGFRNARIRLPSAAAEPGKETPGET